MEQDWFDKVLSNSCAKCVDIVGDKGKYLRFEVEPKSNSCLEGFQSIQICGSIIYKDEHGTTLKSKPLFIKRAMDFWSRKFSFSFSAINELNFYTKVVPVLSTLDSNFSSLFAKFHYGEMILSLEGDQPIIILENLKAKGYKMAEKRSFQSLQHLRLMMRKIGQFHSYSYKAKTRVPDLFYSVAHNFLESNAEVLGETFNIMGICGERGLEYLLRDPAYVKYGPKIRQMLGNARDIFIQILTNDRDNPFSVIVHGDYLRSNVMFKYENDVPVDLMIIDVATYRHGSPVLDLATVLYINSDQETRDKYWDCLIDEYYSALNETFPGNEIPTKNEILMEFIDKSFYAYLIASIYLPYILEYDDNPLPELKISDIQKLENTRESQIKSVSNAGGMAATKALGDVLKDMIDRGFICEQRCQMKNSNTLKSKFSKI